MRKRTKNIFFLVLSILFLYLALAYFGPLRTTTYYGWIEVTGKNTMSDNYYLYASLGGEKLEIVIDEKDTFIYEATPENRSEVSIIEVWDFIKADNTYFMRIKENIFSPTFTLEKLYGY